MNILTLALTTLLASTAFAQENIPSFETVVEDVIFNTSTRVIIDEKTIKESRSPNITTLLASQANVTVTNTPFQPNSIYIRGGDASHVLILIDGVPFYDASTIQRTIDLNSLDIKSIRRIEIIKGSQTVLYGGQALSGVIKIDTIPSEIGTQTSFQGRMGTQSTSEITIVHSNLAANNQGAIFRGHGGWKSLESPVFGSNRTYDRNNWNGEATYVFKGALEGHVKANYIQDLNLSPTTGTNYQIIDADNFEIYTRQLGLSTHLKLNEAPWSPRLALSTQNSLRTFKHPLSTTNASAVDYHYGANLATARFDFTPFKNKATTLLAGLSYTAENFIYRDKGTEISSSFSEQRGLFAKADHTLSENVSLSGGARIENWDHHNIVSTYQMGMTLFRETKLEVATGYKIPSLFQLYSTYGNPELQEERVSQYSLTQGLKLSENQHASVTFFKSHFSNLIVTQGNGPQLKYANVNSSETTGAEIVYTVRPSDSSSVLITYGYQEPKDLEKNMWLSRRPLVNGSIKYFKSWQSHSGSIEVMGTGEKLDRVANNAYTSLPGYAVFNASYNFQYDKELTTYARLNNILDHRYQETYSFYTEGLSALAGFEYQF